MHGSAGFGAWEGRHKELLREAEQARLGRVVRGARVRGSNKKKMVKVPAGVEVRWGLLEDEAKVADLLQLNGMPRWLAFEERYVVAERGGDILAAVRYRTEKERLSLGLLVVDPWAEERLLAVALYSGAEKLARELGVGEVVAGPLPHTEYPREAGYRRVGRHTWRLGVCRSGEGGGSITSRWRRLFDLFGAPAVPFFGASSARK